MSMSHWERVLSLTNWALPSLGIFIICTFLQNKLLCSFSGLPPSVSREAFNPAAAHQAGQDQAAAAAAAAVVPFFRCRRCRRRLRPPRLPRRRDVQAVPGAAVAGDPLVGGRVGGGHPTGAAATATTATAAAAAEDAEVTSEITIHCQNIL